MSGHNSQGQNGPSPPKGDPNGRMNNNRIPTLRIQAETPLPTSSSQTTPIPQPGEKTVQLPPLATSRQIVNSGKLRSITNTPREHNLPYNILQTTRGNNNNNNNSNNNDNNNYTGSNTTQSTTYSRLGKNSKIFFLFVFNVKFLKK